MAKLEMDVDRTRYILPNDQPIVVLEVTEAFKNLSEKEKCYAHYISKAAWIGNLITFLQTSPESGPIFVLLHRFFSAVKPDVFVMLARSNGFTDDEINALLVYTSGVFANGGNYKGFGDTKIIPDLPSERLEVLLQLSDIWDDLKDIYESVKFEMYDLTAGKNCLGYAPYGCTTYFSSNCTAEDTKTAQTWMAQQNLELYNSRLFKYMENGKTVLNTRLASYEKGELRREAFGSKNIEMVLSRGDYSPLMKLIAEHLQQASVYAANDTQKYMLQSYAKSFLSGTLEDHRTGSRFWIADKGPVVETYIGFIETYRDPAGVRGEFEGFVAVVNKPMSEKFGHLVEHAEYLLEHLPWPKEFEKDHFLKPDFTSLDVLTFAGSGIPVGINIPNYDDIRQNEGFKNVSLGNVLLSSYKQTKNQFVVPEDHILLQKYRVHAFEVQVGLHELLGHGSGKLLFISPNTNFPSTLIDPLTNKPPSPCYKNGETFDTLFGPLSSAFEECRAEAVGLYLGLNSKAIEIFGYRDEEASDIQYTMWLLLIVAGLGRSLEMYDLQRGWLQAHARARHVIARVLYEAGVADIKLINGDLQITVKRELIRSVGREALGQFLLKLQVFKSTADVENATALFEHYSTIPEPWLTYRKIVMDKKQPRPIFTQANTSIKETLNEVQLHTYDDNAAGCIESWIERFDEPKILYEHVLHLAQMDKIYFTSGLQ